METIKLIKKAIKETFIGIGKACFYIMFLVLVFWILEGFKTPAQIDIIGIMAVGAILIHFVDKEQLKK